MNEFAGFAIDEILVVVEIEMEKLRGSLRGFNAKQRQNSNSLRSHMRWLQILIGHVYNV